MAIGEDKTRTNITFPKELKTKLEELAKKDNRSFNNLIIKILSDYVKNSQK
jgi:predicted transcriptional regulator